MNYINHLSLYRRDRLLNIGCLRTGFEGSQDYDLVLRYVAELEDSEVRHLPYPAYMWRRDGASYSIKHLDRTATSARRALAEAYAKNGDAIPVGEAVDSRLHRVRFDLTKESFPKVSIVIPNMNSYSLMSRLLDGLLKITDYPDIQIIVIDNGSNELDVLELYDKIRSEHPNVICDTEVVQFNFSRQVNRGMRLAAGELILLLNNDIEIIEKGWLKEMVACFDYQNTGIVGARLLYPNRTLQHAGVIVGLGDLAGHWYINRPADFPGPMARLNVRSSMTAVAGACMMISRACIDQIGFFDEKNFAVAYNDVDFCLRANQAGFRVVYTPFAKLIHYESASRGSDAKGMNRPRFLRDQAALLDAHETETFEDRSFSPWYGRNHSEPSPVVLDKLPDAR